MQTLQPTLRLGRDVWDRAAMPVEEFTGRASRLRDGMRRTGLDALLLYGRGMNSCGHPTWLANYIVKLPFSALVVLPLDGEPALMFEGATRGRSAAQATTWIDDVRPCWNMAETSYAVLANRGLTTGRIGLAGIPRLMPHADWTSLSEGLVGATFVDAETLVWEQRARKSDREMAQVRRAGCIVHESLSGLSGSGERFSAEDAAASFIVHAARRRGAEDIRLMIARPQEPEPAFRPPESAPFGDGGTVSVYLACSWERYWFASLRTFALVGGRPVPAWRAAHEEQFQALATTIRPGGAIGEWVRAALAAVPPAARPLIATIGMGHGVGVTPEEAPALSVGTDDRFDRRMCVMLCTAMHADGERFVAYGDTIEID